MKKITLRLSDELHGQAQAYSQSLGLSLNALISVALSEYLRVRSQAGYFPPEPEPPPPDFFDDGQVTPKGKRKRHKARR